MKKDRIIASPAHEFGFLNVPTSKSADCTSNHQDTAHVGRPGQTIVDIWHESFSCLDFANLTSAIYFEDY